MFFKNDIYSKLKFSSQSIGITFNKKHIQCKKTLIFSYMLKEEIKKHPLGRGVSHWEKAMSNFFVNYGATFNLDI